MFQQDWIMRQIDHAVQFIVKLLFGSELQDRDFVEEIYSGEGGPLLRKIELLMKSGRVNDAENLLFESMTPGDSGTLRVALLFYNRLNDMTDSELDAADFSREEIREGLGDSTRLYGINIMELFDMED